MNNTREMTNPIRSRPAGRVFTAALLLALALLPSLAAAQTCDNWTLVFRHDMTGEVYFTDKTEAMSVNGSMDPMSVQKFSRLTELESLRGADGSFHFKLVYPNGFNEWKQTSNPMDFVEQVTGYQPIQITWTSFYWGGLATSSAAETLLDGSVGNWRWYYSIGSNVAWADGAIPAANSSTTVVELYVCSPPTPADLISALVDTVVSLSLHDGISTALLAKLQDAQTSLAVGGSVTAATALQDFINQVSAQTGKKIDPTTAAQLTADATAIIQLIAG